MSRVSRSAVPKLLTEDERAWYKDLFAAIKRQDWSRVQTMFGERPDGPLHGSARAEYYLAPGSPRIDLATLTDWLNANPTLPQAEQIAALAIKRGGTALPTLPLPQALYTQPNAPRRARPRSIADGTMPATIAQGINDKIKVDDPLGARLLLDGVDATLSAEARAEWRQKVAWAYYINNQDADAFALASSIGDNSAPMSGPWVAEGAWVAGLAAWRLGDCLNAGEAFARTAKGSTNSELTAAAYYWQSRAQVRCRQPEMASAPLRSAARLDETLYGMIAAEQLGLRLPTSHSTPDFTTADWQSLRENPNIRAAVALAEIGEDGLADDVLRHQARIGSAEQYQPLSRLARDLGLPATQLWMAYNAPGGALPAPASRFPTPKWTPATGWQVDPALVLAHTLQESAFRATALSSAGARGLMQIMPAAARDHAASLGVSGSVADLTRPDVNLAFGQQHLQALKNSAATQGLLPKVMAAYNAGPLPVARWNTQIHDGGDPLLWMESVPYWETRGYVATVLRNYWMYERQAGGASESRSALAQGMWPTFPGLDGARGVRMASNGAIAGTAIAASGMNSYQATP
ncbi:lytic transglycosylase domain-containing protein [Novosphingobium sp. KACC 22771]|uniref:lytic transglycosylase domain-containing protein n=1 Tax=Novosphingobium sp. KACC 22771 TaxID=3025670 RepID=UPI002365B637|nr:lytic transglycosylase domain-containing protein [Novosphingobium sp. KACC 22771]WDF74121.1 lytic transglycosylase domain-containing protein [Novosphingobium sp. KACC 22771]